MAAHTVSERDASCHVFTFKEGLLSAVAHDLEIAVERFSIEWDEDPAKIEARFDATSLRVLHPMHDGAPRPGALSARDLEKIGDTIRKDVLKTSRHPSIEVRCDRVEGTGDARTLFARLSLCGREGPLTVRVRQDGGKWIAEATIHQPDFGITPYTAMLGTLRIQPDVRVRVEVPAT